ncbi:hypothetical protein ABXK61_23935 [Burkholderia sola]|nr:hypothetical protein [Burkholderia sp. AcTa6-5]MBP0716337.1 hypothetical protein [Burkholderia sp. AcTa6-5]
MKNKYSLLQMRDVWIDAYISGDIDQLNFVESAHFFVKRRDRILTKVQQIASIQRRLAEKTWPDCGPRIHQDITAIVEDHSWASISGTGSMASNGKDLTRFDYLELWVVNENRWQIAALCYDEKRREAEGVK